MIIKLCLFFGIFILFCAGCGKEEKSTQKQESSQMSQPDTSSSQSTKNLQGIVRETMNAGGYSYVNIEGNGKKFWAAGPQVDVAVGDKVEIPPSPPMQRFNSKSLGRTFDSIIFAQSITVIQKGGQQNDTRQEYSGIPKSKTYTPTKTDFENIHKPDGGYTIEELYSNMEALKEKKIKVAGRVVKFSSGIMGKNFVHLKDGTGKSGEDDLTLTTQQQVTIGDMVTAEGTLIMNRDFGGGYFYKIIIEETVFAVASK